MLPVKQTKDWSVSLFGDTLPKYILYGKIAGIVYTCNPFFPCTIKVHDEKRAIWKTCEISRFPKIKKIVENYIAAGIEGTHIEACQHRQNQKHSEFYRSKRAEAVHAHNLQKDLRAAGLPIEKKPQSNYLPTKDLYGQSAIDGRGYSIDYEYNLWEDKKNPNPMSCDERDKGYVQPFEMGQGTSGNIDGKYTRSGFETKKDGMKIDQNKLRPERMQRPDYMKTSTSNAWKNEDFVNKPVSDKGKKHSSCTTLPPKPVWQQVQEENKKKA